MRILKQSRSAEKCERGGPLGFLKPEIVARHQKTEADTLETKTIFESLTAPKKLKGGPFSLVQFCMLRLKNEK